MFISTSDEENVCHRLHPAQKLFDTCFSLQSTATSHPCSWFILLKKKEEKGCRGQDHLSIINYLSCALHAISSPMQHISLFYTFVCIHIQQVFALRTLCLPALQAYVLRTFVLTCPAGARPFSLSASQILARTVVSVCHWTTSGTTAIAPLAMTVLSASTTLVRNQKHTKGYNECFLVGQDKTKMFCLGLVCFVRLKSILCNLLCVRDFFQNAGCETLFHIFFLTLVRTMISCLGLVLFCLCLTC